MSWVITDNNGHMIKTLKSWNPSSNQTIFNSFSYDFTSEYGSLFSCGYYFVYLQIITQTEGGNLSLCQDNIQIYICEEGGESKGFRSESLPDNIKSFKFYPNPANAELHVEINRPHNERLNLYVLWEDGKIQNLLDAYPGREGSNLFDFDISKVGKGMGYLVLETETILERRKIILK